MARTDGGGAHSVSSSAAAPKAGRSRDLPVGESVTRSGWLGARDGCGHRTSRFAITFRVRGCETRYASEVPRFARDDPEGALLGGSVNCVRAFLVAAVYLSRRPLAKTFGVAWAKADDRRSLLRRRARVRRSDVTVDDAIISV